MSCLYCQTRLVERILAKIYDSFIGKTGIKSTQYSMLKRIANMHNPYISEIGTVLRMDQTTVTRNVAKLQKGGLIETFSLPRNSRKMHVRLTDLGYEKLAEAGILWEEAQALVKNHLGKDFERLSRLLDRVTEVLDYQD